MILRCYTMHCKGGRIRQFRPKGEMLVCMPDGEVLDAAARKKNARASEDVTKYSDGGLSARIFVGLSAPGPGGKQVPRFTIKQVVDAVIEIRKEQKQRPDATFLAQKGIYTEATPGAEGQLVEEDSVQIIIIDIFGTPEETFVQQMTDLGEKLRARFEQKEVILEVQNKGVAVRATERTVQMLADALERHAHRKETK